MANTDEPDAAFHRDRRYHAGAPAHLDDDQLARLTEEERVDAGLEDYDPDGVPPATDEGEPIRDEDGFRPNRHDDE